ncbi:uncharacterized protein N7515_000682 [Penicillium bovifimosum]|uniref:MARVEL domain-containing protein n=1 Tax=Penicillium bovifimosum TaxID=126998 RepID=A0A9W9HFZ6_9EURO|nr:uncharacterized protein N7515_000682 [Penicillium bovifimosum]KAJ5146118.1 hypothetical protein N7515_000682 [Penicillium bovifimosum]
MSFVAIKLLKLGYNQAKKHKAKKEAQKYQDAPYNPTYPQEQHPMTSYPTGAAPGTTIHFNEPKPASKPAFMALSALRFLQFVFGLTVIGLYGRDVHHDHAHADTWHAKWVYALIVAFLATVTAAVHLIVPFVMRKAKANAATGPGLLLPQFVWETVVTVLWLVLFGIFGKMYIGVHGGKGSEGLGDGEKITRMRHAVWVDVINLAFWVVSGAWVLVRWLKSRRVGGEVDAEKAEKI